MKTLYKTAKNISDNSLFVRGGTLSHEQVEQLLNDYKYPYCKAVYKREILDIPAEIERLSDQNKPIWYENRGGGVKFYTVNEQSIRDVLKDRYTQIVKVWNHIRKS